MKIIFVCTGNTCRSPMAEAYLSKIAKNRDIEVKSAGIHTVQGLSASENTYNVLKKNNISVEKHQSSLLDESMVLSADIILTMTLGHKEHIKRLFPEVSKKVFTLKEYASCKNIKEGDLDISDPFGQDLSVYERAFLEIKTSIDAMVEKKKI